MAGKSYVVTGPLATPYREDGTRAYLYQGAEWPDGLRDGETDRFLDLGFIAEVGGSSSEGYSSLKVGELRAEIDKRNEGREDADLLSTEGNKADLIAALEADDNK